MAMPAAVALEICDMPAAKTWSKKPDRVLYRRYQLRQQARVRSSSDIETDDTGGRFGDPPKVEYLVFGFGGDRIDFAMIPVLFEQQTSLHGGGLQRMHIKMCSA
ncbi:hypothetical protein [Rhizobium ruizarguesonis]|uniref:hypothetical protein n=1 Tax=Rhizobium ruizarguesonis TaxID=2081791 RepID=UPI00102FC6C1|nr:hypothetical protein [Rhizobium ruizarguesonis]TBC19540.1 hypothetical protein ELH34_04905 [Rhizobium ruizarguesonis]